MYATVRTVLDGEKYIGHAVYCRSSKKLSGRTTQNAEAEWCRKDDAFEAIVPIELFNAVRGERLRRRKHDSDEKLLDDARRLLKREGRLTAPLIDAEPGLMSSHGLARHFGGLSGLYRSLGYTPSRHNRYAEIRRWLTDWRKSLTAFAIDFLEDGGSLIERDGWRLRIDNAWTLSFVIVHGSRPVGTMQQWFNHRRAEDTDIVVFARAVYGEAGPMDYFVLPRVLFPEWPKCFYTRNHPILDSCRYPSLAILGDLARLSRLESQLCG